MAKTKFLSVILLKDQINHLFSKCDQFVFQQINPDDINKKEITLICYGLSGSTIINPDAPIELQENKSGHPEELKGNKACFGNLPIPSTLLESAFSNNNQIEFIPVPYNHNYMGYKIPVKALADIILNPSPPA